MNDDIREILEQLEQAYTNSACLEPEKAKRYYDAINNLIHNWNELKKWLIKLQKFKGINQQGFSWGVAQEVLDKMQSIEEGGNNEN